MSPCEQLQEPYKSQIGDWDWLAKVPCDVWHRIEADDYPGWDKVGTAPPFILLEVEPSDPSSHEMMVAVDDAVTQCFYSRDWTSDGLPFRRDGESFWSGFWFQSREDAEMVHTRTGGAASWLPDFATSSAAMNDKRNGR